MVDGSWIVLGQLLDYGGAPVVLLAIQWFRQDKALALGLERMRAGFDKRLSLLELQLKQINKGNNK